MKKSNFLRKDIICFGSTVQNIAQKNQNDSIWLSIGCISLIFGHSAVHEHSFCFEVEVFRWLSFWTWHCKLPEKWWFKVCHENRSLQEVKLRRFTIQWKIQHFFVFSCFFVFVFFSFYKQSVFWRPKIHFRGLVEVFGEHQQGWIAIFSHFEKDRNLLVVRNFCIFFLSWLLISFL